MIDFVLWNLGFWKILPKTSGWVVRPLSRKIYRYNPLAYDSVIDYWHAQMEICIIDNKFIHDGEDLTNRYLSAIGGFNYD